MPVNRIVITCLILITSVILPQEDTRIPFLNVPLSPTINGAGAAGTAILTDDPYSFLYNPAHLGFIARNTGISAGFYPQKINWLSRFGIKDSYINSYAFNAGYNFEKELNGLPLSIGFGFSRSKINYAMQLGRWDLEEVYSHKEDYDIYDTYSIGVGYNSVINISAGISYKDISSTLYHYYYDEKYISEVNAFDIGLLVNVPLNNLLKKPVIITIPYLGDILTNVNYTAGYAIRNVGEKSYYIDIAQEKPIGRTASLGHSIQIDLNINTERYQSELLKLVYSINSDDILVKSIDDSTRGISGVKNYKGIMGDIKPIKNLFLGKGDPDVVLHKGFTVELVEAVSYSVGGVSQSGEYNHTTNGYSIKLKGILKLVNIPLQNKIIKYICDHFNIQYSQSEYYVDRNIKNQFEGITVRLEGLY